MQFIKKIPTFFHKRIGFMALLVLLLWAKSIFAYCMDFTLTLNSPFQWFILFINPFATTIFLLGIALYVRGKKAFYITAMTIYTLLTLLLFSNVTYYREFTDFLTINTILSTGKVLSGLGEGAANLLSFHYIFYFLDIVVLIVLLLTRKIKMDAAVFKGRAAIAISAFSVMLFSANLFLAETDRPELLKRTFSKDYIVKYLGINAFTVYDGFQTYQSNRVRAQASSTDFASVEQYVREHYAAPDPNYFGIAKGKNVIEIHLESFQQFLMDYKLKDENGTEHEVMPFLNSIYHSNATIAFDNFFHQVNAGKTSDAETLFENSFFGLSQGPLFTQLGGKNTFEASPAILEQAAGYTTAVFHGNDGSFWNRTETYKRLGYDYFFDKSYFDLDGDNSFQYGLHDKPFFEQSVQYLEHLQQPFFTKFITVSNHYPFEQFKNEEAGFPLAQTNDDTVNGYFATANYLDSALKEFFTYLKESGLYDKSIIVLYGDHYGISNSRNPDLAELLGKDKETWSRYDNAMLQRVPYMIHIPGYTLGGIDHTFGGQIDTLPTLLHLLGINTENYMQLGQDLLSPEHQNIVSFRNGNIVSKDYTILGDDIYRTDTGEEITVPDEAMKKTIQQDKEISQKQLSFSDKLTTGDLLRFYTKSGLKPVESEEYDYKNELKQLEKIERKKGDKSTSLFSQNGDKSTMDLYIVQTYSQIHGKTEKNESSGSESSAGKK